MRSLSSRRSSAGLSPVLKAARTVSSSQVRVKASRWPQAARYWISPRRRDGSSWRRWPRRVNQPSSSESSRPQGKVRRLKGSSKPSIPASSP